MVELENKSGSFGSPSWIQLQLSRKEKLQIVLTQSIGNFGLPAPFVLGWIQNFSQGLRLYFSHSLRAHKSQKVGYFLLKSIKFEKCELDQTTAV